MTKWLSIFLCSFVSLFRTRRNLAFENLLLRQQLAVLREKGTRPNVAFCIEVSSEYGPKVYACYTAFSLYKYKLDSAKRYERTYR